MEDLFWKIMVYGILGFTSIIASCSSIQNYQDNASIVEMVAKGADPIRAACAVRSGEERNRQCLILTAKGE